MPGFTLREKSAELLRSVKILHSSRGLIGDFTSHASGVFGMDCLPCVTFNAENAREISSLEETCTNLSCRANRLSELGSRTNEIPFSRTYRLTMVS